MAGGKEMLERGYEAFEAAFKFQSTKIREAAGDVVECSVCNSARFWRCGSCGTSDNAVVLEDANAYVCVNMVCGKGVGSFSPQTVAWC